MAITNLTGDYNLKTPRQGGSLTPKYLVNDSIVFDQPINSEADFPVQDSTTITLEAATNYVALTSFSTAKRFVCENGSGITANNQFGPSVTYTGTGNMFTGDGSFFINDITVSCPTAQAFSFVASTPGTGIFLAVNVAVAECTKWGTYEDIITVDISGCNCPDADDGITMIGSSSLIVSLQKFALLSSSVTFKGLDFGAAVISNIEAANLIFIAPAGAFGISGLVDSGNVPTGSLAMIRDSSFSGGMTDLENITPNDIRWTFRDNSPTRDTFADALLTFSGSSTETVIGTKNIPVIVNAVWIVVQTSLFTGTTGGRATYNAEKDLPAPIDISAGLISAGGGGIDVTVYVAIDGSIIANSGTQLAIAGNSAQTISIPWQETLSEDAFVEVFVENNTNTNNIIVESCKLRVR